jgi:FHA domain
MSDSPPPAWETGLDARLIVHGPDGDERERFDLAGDRVTIGRLASLNDIALEPDPQQLVTRQEHCALERAGSRWFVVDTGSVNGTYVRRRGDLERVRGRIELADGDAVCIVASLSEDRKPTYWELDFDDRGRTRGASLAPRPACLAYDGEQARLFLVQGSSRQEIPLRPQTHRLVRFMAERNAAGEGAPVLCTHAELMEAVWADEPRHTREELNKLFWELRRKLEPLGAEELFESERGLGYRMRSCP